MKRVAVVALLIGLARTASAVEPSPDALIDHLLARTAQGEALPAVPVTPREAGVTVREFRVVGNHVLSPAEIDTALAPYTGRTLTAGGLVEARDALTSLYVQRGYVNSGAVIPEQTPVDGVVEIQVVEGVVSELVVETDGGLSPYVERRLRETTRRPLNALEIEEQLEILQADPRVREVHAEILPGAERGQSALRVEVVEERRTGLTLSLDNDVSPALGEERAGSRFEVLDLLGYGDAFGLELELAEGLRDVEARYVAPVGARTFLELDGRLSSGDVVERGFEELDIESFAQRYGAYLRRVLRQTRSSELALGAGFDWSRANSELLGEPFSFALGADGGETTVTAGRLFQEWISRGRRRALALRSTLSLGIDALGATNEGSPPGGPEAPDASFAAWLGQFQWAERLPERFFRGAELLGRADLQLASEPLAAQEQFALGGMRTVRGYRKNQLVRDSGYAASLELRYPLLRAGSGRHLLQLAPFVDLGSAWSHDEFGGPNSLASAGLGLRWQPREELVFAIYWGGRLRDVDVEADGLQRAGISLEAVWRAF